MENSFGRQAAARINETRRSMATLIGVAKGILADRRLNDAEIGFLMEWLDNNFAIASAWPGSVVVDRIRTILADGVVTEDERDDLMKTLQAITGGTLEDLATSKHVATLSLDEIDQIVFQGAEFCLTGDFVMGRKAVCEKAIADRGGIMKSSVSKKLRYLVAGGLGSPEWKHGSFGTKIERAMQLKQEGAALLIVHEDVLARSLQG